MYSLYTIWKCNRVFQISHLADQHPKKKKHVFLTPLLSAIYIKSHTTRQKLIQNHLVLMFWYDMLHKCITKNKIIKIIIKGGAFPSKTKLIHCVFSGSDVRSKWRLLCSLLHPTIEHLNRYEPFLSTSLLRHRNNGSQTATAHSRRV